MKQKEFAINRCSAFIADRIDNAVLKGTTTQFVTKEAIRALLAYEFQSLPDGEEVKVTW
jgi:hypothetical protein